METKHVTTGGVWWRREATTCALSSWERRNVAWSPSCPCLPLAARHPLCQEGTLCYPGLCEPTRVGRRGSSRKWLHTSPSCHIRYASSSLPGGFLPEKKPRSTLRISEQQCLAFLLGLKLQLWLILGRRKWKHSKTMNY